MKKHIISVIVIILVAMMVGCGAVSIKSSVSRFSPDDAQRYTSIQKIAILPFENLTKTKDANRLVNALFITDIINEDVFNSVEDVRYVNSVMKMLKIKRTQMLDRDIVFKMGEEMKCEAIVVGEIDAYKIGKKDESTDISISATMFDTRSGDILWTSNATYSASTSVGKVFGVTPGPNHIEMTTAIVEALADSLADRVDDARNDETRLLREQVNEDLEGDDEALSEDDGEVEDADYDENIDEDIPLDDEGEEGIIEE